MKVIMVMAQTLDGKIAKSSDHFPDWTSREDKKYFAKISKEAGVVIMGDKTFFTFPAPLKERLNVVFTMQKDPENIEGVKWVEGEPKKILEELRRMGYKSVVLGGGTAVNSMFLKEKLIDELHITIEPKIFGDGLGLFKGDFDLKLNLIECEKINDDAVVLKYKILK